MKRYKVIFLLLFALVLSLNAKVTEADTVIFKKNVYDYRKNPTQWVLESKRPCIIDYYTTWCGPCKRVAPIMEQLSEEYAGKVDFYKIDAEKERDLARIFRVGSYPTIVFCSTDGQPQPIPGARSKEEFKLLIDAILLKEPKAVAALQKQNEAAQAENQKIIEQQRKENSKFFEDERIKPLTKAEFLTKVFNYEKKPNEWKFLGKKPCIIDFYATWCGPCKILSPTLKEIAAEYDGKIDVYRIDVDVEKELAAVFQVQSIPTLYFCPLSESPQVAKGVLDKNTLVQVITEVLKVKAP
jgi:thioredoxin